MKDEIVLRLNYQRLTYSEGILQIVLQDSFTTFTIYDGHTFGVLLVNLKGVAAVERKKEGRFLVFQTYFPRLEPERVVASRGRGCRPSDILFIVSL